MPNRNSQVNHELVPPHSREVEELVLGAILLEDTAIHRVIDIIKVETFFFPEHQYIFEAAETLFKKSKVVNIITVHEELKTAGRINDQLSISHLSMLANMVTNTLTLEQHTRFIEEKAIARREINIAHRKIDELYQADKDVFDVLADTDKQSYDARNSITAFKKVSLEHIVDDFKIHLDNVKNNHGLIGLNTGLTRLNDITGGFQKGDLITIAARPAMGKSAVAAYTQYHHKEPSIYFSMEMTQRQLVSRICSMVLSDKYNTKIAYRDIQRRTFSEEQSELVFDTLSDVAKLPIYLDDTRGLNVTQIKAKLMKYKNDYGITSAYIDYIQLMEMPDTKRGDNRAQGISQICTELKNMAGAFDMPIIQLSQVDREVGKSGKYRIPTMADLKDSGGLEEKSDLILTLFRPDALANTDYVNDDPDDKDAIYISGAKQKMGDNDLMRLPFDIATNWFPNFGNLSAPHVIYDDKASSNFIIRPSKMSDEDPPF